MQASTLKKVFKVLFLGVYLPNIIVVGTICIFTPVSVLLTVAGIIEMVIMTLAFAAFGIVVWLIGEGQTANTNELTEELFKKVKNINQS